MRLATLLCMLLFAGCATEPTTESPSADPEPEAPEVERPNWVENAVLYEVSVRSFTEEGTFQAIIPRLDALKAMSVTTIWLMPIHPVGEAERKGRLGSPYSVRDYRAVDPAFGTLEDFRALVDATHERGMTLILDWIANHTARDHAWTQAHPDWYTQDEAGTIVHPEGTDWTDVADLNYDNPAVHEAMAAAMQYWVETFEVDGFRCDVAGMVPEAFWQETLSQLRTLKPLMLLAEGDDPWLHEAGFDLTYGWNTFHALKDVWDGAPPDSLYAKLEAEQALYPPDALRLRFITNHDETSWDEAAVTMYDGVEGTKAAMAVAATLPGVPLLYNGQEVAAPQRMNLFEDEKIDWALNPELREFYTALLGLSRNSEALRMGSFRPLSAGDDVIAYIREHESERVLVVVNPRASEQEVVLPEAALGTAMQDVFTDAEASTAFALAPYGIRLFRGLAARAD
ncbi:MAG: alpha-amylase [Rhodothermaceae bacterium]|nr:alpha-amylase [Rhodothermaceae bacterium]